MGCRCCWCTLLTFSQDATTYVLQWVVDVVGALDDGAGAVAVALDEERTRWFPGVRVRSVLESDARRDPLGARLAHARTGRAVLVLLVLTWKEGRKDGDVLFNDIFKHILFTVILQWTYGKGPFREVERKSDATTSWKDLQTLDLTLEGRKDGYVLFNDILNTFYLHLSMDIW